jgi:predicted secreted acid phosphatase
LNDAQLSINSNRATQSEIVKTMENMRRESVSQIEQTHIRLRQEMSDTNNQLMQRITDKLERLRDEIEYKSKETEKVKEEDLREFGFSRSSENRIINLNMNNVNDKYKPYKAILNNRLKY